MKKLLAWLLILLLALPAGFVLAEDAAVLPVVGDAVGGFTVIHVSRYELFDADVVTYRHDKTGASVMMVLNEDTNRFFNIGFRTPATDDRGTPHVFEHATLDGSEKYPSSSLFFNLANQTYNTYMNASTYTFGFTCYPLASLSEEQLLSLSDFYLDSVFHPMLMVDEAIFDEEAWRYAMDSADGGLRIEGTVYSEMTASYTLGAAHLKNVEKALFPGSFVGNYTGGNPVDIPDLTWQDLKDYHNAYYHPSNSLTLLYGKIENAAEFLALLDQYFSEYEAVEFDFTDYGYELRTEYEKVDLAFPVYADSDTRHASMVTYAFLLPDATEEEMQILDNLTTILYNAASPLQQACLEELSTMDMDCYVSDNYPDCAVYFNLYNVNRSYAEEFREVILSVMGGIVKAGGFQSSLIDAVEHEQKLSTLLIREETNVFDYLTSSIFYGWFLTDDPYGFATYIDVLDRLHEFNDSGAYVDVIEKYILNNEASVLVTTYPEAGGQEELDAALAAELAEVRAGMTEEEIAGIVAATQARSETSDDVAAEYVAQLQAVTVDTLPEEIRMYEIIDETDGDNVRRLFADAEVPGVGTALLMLDASGIPQEDLHWYRMFAALAGAMDTPEHSYSELAELSTRYLYGYAVNTSVFDDQDGDGIKPYFQISFQALDEDMDEAYDLLYEMLFETDFSDVNRIAEALAGQKSYLRSTLNNSPYMLLYYLPIARVSESTAYANYIILLDFYEFLCQAEEEILQNPDAAVARLTAVQQQLRNRWGAISGYAGSEEGGAAHAAAADAFLAKLDCAPIVPAEYDFGEITRAEAVIVDSGVQYNMVCASYEELGLDGFTADLDAVNQLVNDMFLTPLLREQYGVYTIVAESVLDSMYLYTYADPSIAETYQVFEALPDLLREYRCDQEVLDGYIMSCYSQYALPEGELTGAYNAMLNLISGVTQEDILEYMRQLKDTSAEDIASYADVYQALVENGGICTVGNAGAIGDADELFLRVQNPFSAVDRSGVDFADAGEDSDYYIPVRFAFENGLMAAAEEGRFGTDDPVTLGDVSIAMAALTGMNMTGDEAIAYLAQYGIVPGDGAADEQLTREQMAEVMCHFCYAVGENITPSSDLPDAPDAADVTPGCEDFFAFLIEMGAVEVREDGSIAPQELATRGEYALMLLALFAV